MIPGRGNVFTNDDATTLFSILPTIHVPDYQLVSLIFTT